MTDKQAQGSPWERTVQSIITDSAQALLELCRQRTLDSGQAISEVMRTICLITRIDPSQSRIELASEMMKHVIPGIGWLEYYEQAGLGYWTEYFGGMIDLICQRGLDLDRLGQILLAILRADEQALDLLKANGATIRFRSGGPVPIVDLLLNVIGYSVSPSADIFEYLLETYVDQHRQDGLLSYSLQDAIRNSNLAVVRAITPLIKKWPLTWECAQIIQCLIQTGSKSIDPESHEHEIVTFVMNYFRASKIPIIDEELQPIFLTAAQQPGTAGFLLWIARNIPEDVRANLQIIMLYRWARRDRDALFELMTQFQVDREQLIEWARQEKKPVVADGYGAYLAYPKQEDLNEDWLSSLRSQKSAYSVSVIARD